MPLPSSHAAGALGANEPLALSFALKFARGRGLVQAAPASIGPLQLDTLVLELTRLSFPFDLSGGAERFASRRTQLVDLSLRLDRATLTAWMGQVDWRSCGLGPVEFSCHEGGLLLSGSLLWAPEYQPELHNLPTQIDFSAAQHGAETPFSCQLTWLPAADGSLALAFSELLLWGPARELGALEIPRRLFGALAPLFGASLTQTGSAVWRLWPAQFAAAQILPRLGWKIASTQGACVAKLAINEQGLTLHCAQGPAQQQDEVPQAKVELPLPVRLALSGSYGQDEAEALVLAGKIDEARCAFAARLLVAPRSQAEDVAWARLALLTLCATHPQWLHVGWRLAPLCAELDSFSSPVGLPAIRANLAQAALGWSKRGGLCEPVAGSVAANLLAALPKGVDEELLTDAALPEAVGKLWQEVARSAVGPKVSKLAQAAAGCALTEQAPEAAQAYLEAAVAAGANWPHVWATLTGLRWGSQSYAEAADSAQCWLTALADMGRDDGDDTARAHLVAGTLALRYLRRWPQAQRHFETLLAAQPHHPGALEGLVMTLAAAGEVERARQLLRQRQSTFSSAPHAAAAAAELVRLGDIWQRCLGEMPGANACYEHALARMPEHGGALLRLANLAKGRGDLVNWAALLEQVVSSDVPGEAQLGQQGHDTLDIPALVAVHLELASYHLEASSEAPQGRDQARGLWHLRRALILEPEREAIRMRLEEGLRQVGDWAALAELLVTTGEHAAAVGGDFERARRWWLQAAKLYLNEHHSPAQARPPLERLLAARPDDTEVLALLLPLYRAEGELGAQANALAAAAKKAHSRGHAIAAATFDIDALVLAQEHDEPLCQQLARVERIVANLPQHLGMARRRVELLEQLIAQGSDDLPELNGRLVRSYEQLAYAAPVALERANALLLAAHTLAAQQQQQQAFIRIEECLSCHPHQLGAWLLGAELVASLSGSAAASVWLRAALQTGHEGLHNSYLSQIYATLARLCQATDDFIGESDALEQVIAYGGNSRDTAQALVTSLERQGRELELAQWLERWADAGWPLEMGPGYRRAAELYLAADDLEAGRRVLRQALSVGDEELADLGQRLADLGETHGMLADRIDGLVAQVRAAERAGDDLAQLLRLKANLLACQREAGQWSGAEITCAELLGLDAGCAWAHLHLAEVASTQGRWDAALDHRLFAARRYRSAGCNQEETDKAQQNLNEAYALAREVRPALIDELCEMAAPRQLDAPPLGEQLVADGHFEQLRALLSYRLERAQEATKGEIRLRLAAVLCDQLEAPQAAQVLLRANLAQDPHDLDSRQVLLRVYQRLGDRQAQAELHFTLSQREGDHVQALDHALAAAALYAELKDGRQVAEQILLTFAQRRDVPISYPALWEGLKSLGLHRALASLLANSLIAQPASDDGRFVELVHLLAGPLAAKDEALAWCQRIAQKFSDDDAPFVLHLAVLLPEGELPSAANQDLAEQVYRSWVAVRTGEAKAGVLEAMAQHLRSCGEPARALAALESALDVPDAAPQRSRARLTTLVDRYVARGDFAGATQTLERLVLALPAGEEADQVLRRQAELAAGHLGDQGQALKALQQLTAPTQADLAQMARLALQQGDFETIAGPPSLCTALDTQQLWEAGQALCSRRLLVPTQVVFDALLVRLGEHLSASDLPQGKPATDRLGVTLGDGTFGMTLTGQAGAAAPTPSAVWALAEQAWLSVGARRALCAWRLTWAEIAPQKWSVAARLVALCELHELHANQGAGGPEVHAGRPGDDARLSAATSHAAAEALLEQADLGHVGHAWPAFRLACLLGYELQRGLIARALLNLLVPSDPRLGEVLVACAEAACAGGDGEAALALSAQLEAIKDPRAIGQRIAALRLLGRQKELLVLLATSAEQAAPEQAEQHWLCLAEEQRRQRDFDGARVSLGKVPSVGRSLAWAHLAYTLEQEAQSAEGQAAAAALAAHVATSASERAIWQRREAAVRWWALGDSHAGKQLLQSAQAQHPLTRADIEAELIRLPVDQARQRLEESLIILPAAHHASMWRRLAALVPLGTERDDALARALGACQDDADELTLILEAARAAQSSDLLRQALERLARVVRPSAPARAAGLWLEAARLTPVSSAAPLWVEAALAHLAAGNRDEALALTRRAQGAGVRSESLWRLVWELMPPSDPARLQASAGLVAAGRMPKAVGERATLMLAAAEHALVAGEPGRALELVHRLRHELGAQVLAAADICAVLAVEERALEASGKAQELVGLWLQAADDVQAPAEHVLSRLRRAAYLVAPLLASEEARSVWLRLVAADPEDHEAVAQLWVLTARHAQQRGIGDGGVVQTLVADIEARLRPMVASEARVKLALLAANLLGRHREGRTQATALVGRELHHAMAAWQRVRPEHGGAQDLAWLAVVQLSRELNVRLAESGQTKQQLAVLAHTARLAPQAEQEAHLEAAGLMARDLGDAQLAFALLHPVALANPGHDEAMAVCLSFAKAKRRGEVVIDLLTRRAQRLAAAEAAVLFEDAADWARHDLNDPGQELRLLQAAQALAPASARTQRLVMALGQAGGLQNLVSAQQLLLATQLPAASLRKLGLAVARALDAFEGGQSAAAALWDHLSGRFPHLPEVRIWRLARARASGNAQDLLSALQFSLQDQHVPCGQGQASLHAETAALAAELGQVAQAVEHFAMALSGRTPQASWLADAQRLAQAQQPGTELVLVQTALGEQVGRWVRAARTALLAQAASTQLSTHDRLSALQLVAAQEVWGTGELAQALAAGQDLGEALSRAPEGEQQLEQQRLQAKLLTHARDFSALAQHLEQFAQALPIGSERARIQRDLGQVLGEKLGDWPASVSCLLGALAEQPGDEDLRLAAATALVAAGRPHEALPYVRPADETSLQELASGQLEVLLQAQVMAHLWREVLPVAQILLGRQPGSLTALRAQARATLAQGQWAEAEEAHQTLADALQADGPVAAWRRANGRSAEPEAVDVQERAAALDELAQLAGRRNDGRRVCDTLRAALALSQTAQDARRRRVALRQACLVQGAWAEAAQLAYDEAEAAPSKREAASHLLEAAALWQSRCGDTAAARRALWRAADLAADEAAVWWQLRGVLSEASAATERQTVAEHLLALVPHAHFDARLWAELAAAFAHSDASRANALFGQAEAAGGVPEAMRAVWAEAAWQAGDMSNFVSLAEALEGLAAQVNELRLLRLAEGCLSAAPATAGSNKDRARWLGRVLATELALTEEGALAQLRRLADVCAGDPSLHRAGIRLYERLLQHQPLDPHVLRIAARLAGGLGDTDRAYGFYACLLWLLPDDQEAERFVSACRAHQAAQQDPARSTTKLLVRRVQQALDQLDQAGALTDDVRPRRAYDVAQLLRRDIEAVLGQMLPVPSAMPRPRALSRSPEALALFCFAQSPAYFTLRQHLGAELSSSGQPHAGRLST